MKKYRTLVIAAVAMGAAMMARAASEVVDGVTWYYGTSLQWNSQTQKNETYAYITSGSDKYAGDLTVPSSLGGYAVKMIGSSAFSGCSALTSVTIPEGVTSIGYYAFCSCSSLTSVTIPEGVTSIGDSAFSGCSALTSVTIPEGVTAIGQCAFYNCSSLFDVTIPESVAEIGQYTFYKCIALEDVVIPDGVTRIGAHAFEYCEGMERIVISDSVDSIGDWAFSGCFALSEITLPKQLSSFGEGVFNGCCSLKTLSIPAGVSSLGYCALNCCQTLVDVTMPETVTSIGSYAFGSCFALERITIPASVTSIGDNAFYSCSALTSVTFEGAPPTGVSNSCLLSKSHNSYPRQHGAAWLSVLGGIGSFPGFVQWPMASVVSSKIRVNNPMILDVVYKVTSSQPTVKVRALAFEDGVRSFTNVVRPETFVADTNGVETAGNVGDTVAANVEHTLSWKVSSDWSNQLAKVTFEVLASEGDLLPLEVRTIPASEQYGKMDVTWNAISESQWFDALLWLYADKTEGLTLVEGKLKSDEVVLANGSSLVRKSAGGGLLGRGSSSGPYTTSEYVLGKMGYTLLSGEVLDYVNEETRLGLSPSGVRQYGYKIVGE